jgi:hypothetical protein
LKFSRRSNNKYTNKNAIHDPKRAKSIFFFINNSKNRATSPNRNIPKAMLIDFGITSIIALSR